MPILKLTPSCKDYLWGGSRLRTDFGIKSDLEPLAEAWVLSCHPDGPSYLPDGTTLAAYIAAHPGCLGTDCDRFEQFPILTKFIDAKQNLSVQVHPSNEYALEKEHQYGKTEMWYVLDCVPGAYLYYGFTHEISKEEFAERIKNNTLTEVLNAVPVHKGDCFFIPSGTLHAICQGIVVVEVQQNSNVTYRVYDYGRVGADGKQHYIERFPNQLEALYKGRQGYIYLLDSTDGLTHGKGHSWESKHDVPISQCESIADVYSEILREESLGNIIIHRYAEIDPAEQKKHANYIRDHLTDEGEEMAKFYCTHFSALWD